MRYILNFNPEATSLLGKGNTALELTTSTTKRRGTTTLVQANNGDGPAFSPRQPGSGSFKTRLAVGEARSAGIRGSQRYTLERRGNTERFYLVPHSQVRNGKRVSVDGPAVTVSLTER